MFWFSQSCLLQNHVVAAPLHVVEAIRSGSREGLRDKGTFARVSRRGIARLTACRRATL